MAIHIRPHHIALVGLIMSCSGPTTRPVITASPTIEVNATPRTTIVREALYARPFGELQPKIEPTLNGFVEAVQKTSDGYYLHISHTDGWQAHVDFIVDIPGVHARAVSEMGIVMRVPIDQVGGIPNEFDIQANFQADGEPFMWRGRGSLQTIRVKVPENPEVSDEIETLFLRGAGDWFDYGGVWKMAPTFDFMEYASRRFEAQADPDSRAYWTPTKIGLRRSKKPRRITSVDLALGSPLSAGRVPGYVSAMASGFIDLHDIDARRFDANKVAAHPERTRDWSAMLEKLDGTPSVEPLARHHETGRRPSSSSRTKPSRRAGLPGGGSHVCAATKDSRGSPR